MKIKYDRNSGKFHFVSPLETLVLLRPIKTKQSVLLLLYSQNRTVAIGQRIKFVFILLREG